MEKRKEKYFTLMIVPHSGEGKPFSLKVPMLWVYAAVGLISFLLLLSFSSFIYSSHLTRRLFYYASTLSKNREQRQVISSFSSEKKKISEAISELKESDSELRKLLGLQSWKSKLKLGTDESSLDSDLKLVSQNISERKESLQELKEWVGYVQKRLASTPASWPIYGKIVSWFGYRVYPWRGFHAGIDISSRYGQAVRATADGVVSYVGWRQGYGRIVEIKHGHGVLTLYAHNSKGIVSVGQWVRRGQIISYVGSTGYATGPHLHYEVRKWGEARNPVAYLNLNILSASRLWR